MQSLTRAARHSVLSDMNDRVREMRSCGLLLLAACSSDPTLDVSVHHPTGYVVKQTVVTVYAGDDVSCSQVEFGDRTDAELGAITVDEVDVTSGGTIEVSRLGGKSLVARGFDGQHRFVTAGCKDLGEIAGHAKVTIDTQATAVVAIDPGQPDRPFGERTILVNMTDTNGKPIEGTVSWLLTGPAGAPVQQPSAGVATKNGDARIHVEDLGMPGPEAMRIRVPWATAPLPLVTAFDVSGSTTIALPGGNLGGHPSCDVRAHAGRLPTLVCLAPADVQGHRDVIDIAWQGTRYVTSTLAIPAALDNQFALFVDHDGTPDESVYVISANATGAGTWWKLGDPAGSARPVAFDSALENIVYIPRCASGGSALVAVQTGTVALGSKQQFFLPSGAPAGTTQPQDGEVLSGGCVADVDKREHQAVVIATAAGEAMLVLIAAGAAQMPIPSSRLTGSGFVAVTSGNMVEKRFAGTRLQATGTVVFEAVLAPDAGSFKLVERTEVEAAAPPTKIIGGKLDRDGDTDLMWDMNAGLRRRVFQVSLAKQVSGAPLTAMTSGPSGPSTANTAAADFLAGDLDGQLTDEMVVFSASAVTIFSPD